MMLYIFIHDNEIIVMYKYYYQQIYIVYGAND